MEGKNFTELVKGPKGLVYVINGADVESGRPAWWVVEVDKVKESIIKNASKYKQLKISDYGKILDSGFGESAPQDVLDRYK